MFFDGLPVAVLDSLMLCYPERLAVQIRVNATGIQISADSSTVTYIDPDSRVLQGALERLNSTMQNPISTYVGGIPGWSEQVSIIQIVVF